MQRERCAQQDGNAALDQSEVTEPDRTQFERNLAGRGSFRLLRSAIAAGTAGKFEKMCRHRRRSLSGRCSGERRPEQRRIRELTSEIPIHGIPGSSVLS